MRILVLSIYYPPEPGANARIVSELATAWQRAGHEVTVLTDIPHYPDDVVPEEYKRGQRRDEQMDGVRVIRNPLIIRNRASTLGRLLNNLSFAFSAVWGARKAGKVDVIYVYSPPIFLGIGAWLIKLFKRAPVIFNVQDIYPDVAIAHGFLTNRFLIRAFKAFEKWVYNRSTRITVISKGFRQNLLSKRVPDHKIDIIPNCVDAEQFTEREHENEFRRELNLNGKFMVLYGGNLGHAQGLETVIEAARLLEHKRDDIEFVIVGDGVEGESLRKLHTKYGLGNLRFTGPVPRARMPEIVAAADTCLVILRAHKSRIWIQSKTYEIMASGRPIIASIDADGDNWRLIDEAGAGIHATPGDPKALADAAERLADDPGLRQQFGESGRRHIVDHYTLEQIAGYYVKSMERAVQPRRKPARHERPDPARITILNQFYPPDLSPTSHLSASLAEHRKALGDFVTVVTSSGGFLLSKDSAPLERSANPRVHRLWSPGLGKSTVIRRSLDYTTFYLLAAIRMLTLRRQDVIISLTTPPCIAWVAVLHKLFHPRTKLILWNMDVYPDVAVRTKTIKENGMLARLMRARNRSIFKKLDHIVCLDSAMAELIENQYKEHNPNLLHSVVPNWEPMGFFEENAKLHDWPKGRELGLDDTFVVLYLGNTGYGHKFETVIEAAEKLRDENVVFLFVGGGTRWETIVGECRQRSLTNVIMHDYIAKEQTPALMAMCDAGLTTLRDEMLGTISPSKFHSNLAMRLPIIYIGPESSNVDEAIRKFECGRSFRHGQVDDLVRFILHLRDDREYHNRLRTNARRAFEESFSDQVCVPMFDAVIEQTLVRDASGHTRPAEPGAGSGRSDSPMRESSLVGSRAGADGRE